MLVVGEMPDPIPAAGEVRIRIAASGINPGDVKKRQDAFGVGMPYPRVIPHSDGAGRVDQLGAGVPSEWMGRSVWCYGAQSYRPFGTAAEFTVVPVDHVAPLPKMCHGARRLPWHTRHHGAPSRSCRRFCEGTHCFGARSGRFRGACAVQLARFAGARVIGTVRSSSDEATAKSAGAQEVLVGDKELTSRVKALAPDGIDHIVEVAFGANIEADVELLKQGGSIASYATDNAAPKIPFWQMVFKNIRVFFLGSDDFPKEAKLQAARDLNAALEAGWLGFEIGERIPLADIARAHELVEHPVRRGRVVVVV